MLNKDRQCCESWRDAELGVCAVCAVGATTDEDRWVDLLCCLPHCDTAESCLLTNDMLTTFSSSSDCYDDWRRPSLTICRPFYDASSPFHQCCLLRSCYNASAAQRLLLAASYICLVTFSVLYYVTDSFFPIVPLSISLDIVLSHISQYYSQLVSRAKLTLAITLNLTPILTLTSWVRDELTWGRVDPYPNEHFLWPFEFLVWLQTAHDCCLYVRDCNVN